MKDKFNFLNRKFDTKETLEEYVKRLYEVSIPGKIPDFEVKHKLMSSMLEVEKFEGPISFARLWNDENTTSETLLEDYKQFKLT